ncbi:MAG: hypothetical protein KAW12_13395 [Candidatus Aminicenantes bacterium]|nr:hypothetical protein [Candidatus Aminicenantes bacterium]
MMKIRGKKIFRNGRIFRPFAATLNKLVKNVHNMGIVWCGAGIAGKNHCWPKFGAQISLVWKRNFRSQLKKAKGLGVPVLIGMFSGKLLVTASRGRDKRNITVWHPDHGAPGNNVQDNFFDQGRKMQKELLSYVVKSIKKIGVEAMIVFMWESQVVAGNPKFLPWVVSMMRHVKQLAPDIPIGIHNHHSDLIAAIQESYRNIFFFQEGDAAKVAGLNRLPAAGIVGNLNPGKFPPNRPWEMFQKGWQWIVQQAQKSILWSLINIGCAGPLYKRWYVRKEALADLPKKYHHILGEYRFDLVEKIMDGFCRRVGAELRKYGGASSLPANFGKHLLWKPPAPETDPQPDPEPEPQPDPKPDPPAPAPPPPTPAKAPIFRLTWRFPFLHISFPALWRKYRSNWIAWAILLGVILLVFLGVIL